MFIATQRCGQINKPLRVGDDVASLLGGDLSYGRSSIAVNDMISYLGLLRLWFACVTESLSNGFGYLRVTETRALQEAADIASGKTRAPALIPESDRVAEAPKILLNRRAKRILARGLPASRQYGWFRYASSRTLNGNQFFELLGRVSVIGRAAVYRLEYRSRLCVRRPSCTERRQGPLSAYATSLNLGYCAAHLWPG